jgi:hypothetical protein
MTSTGGSNDLDKMTAGEELFLVHLSRAEATGPDPTDYDREASSGLLQGGRRLRGSSIVASETGGNEDGEDDPTPGEELWKVHCKRCEGSDPDYDEDAEAGPLEDEKAPPSSPRSSARSGTKPNKKGKREEIGGAGAPRSDQGRVIHLRSRDVALR